MGMCPNFRRGVIYLGFDRPMDGVETEAAAAHVVVSSASRSAFRRGLAHTFTPPPGFSLCSSPLAPSCSYRQARPHPFAARSERAPKSSVSLKDAALGASCIPASDAFNHAPHPPRRYRLTLAARTGCAPAASNPSLRDGSSGVPYPRITTTRSHYDSHR